MANLDRGLEYELASEVLEANRTYLESLPGMRRVGVSAIEAEDDDYCIELVLEKPLEHGSSLPPVLIDPKSMVCVVLKIVIDPE
jgi:hypothetical protein